MRDTELSVRDARKRKKKKRRWWEQGLLALTLALTLVGLAEHVDVQQLSAHAIEHGLHAPLKQMYRHAPAVGQFGGWQGQSPEQACARLSGQRESFWLEHADECEDLLDARFRSFLLTAQSVGWFFAVYRLAQGVGSLAWLYVTRRVAGTEVEVADGWREKRG